MDKSKSPPRSPNEKIIRIKLLDIFPSIKEFQQQQNETDRLKNTHQIDLQY